jgi:uncharacterized protein (TIGR03435 family)
MKLMSVALLSIAAAGAQEFEVASVKPSGWFDGMCPQSMKLDRGRITIGCATMRTLIGYAWRMSPERVQGPAWMMVLSPPRFDIAATIPAGAQPDRVPEMMQALLAARFGLVLHRGDSRQEYYALTVAKGGVQLAPAAATPAAESDSAEADFFGDVQTRTAAAGMIFSNPRMGSVLETAGKLQAQQWHAPNISMAGLADLLDKVAPIQTPIIDRTGLSGRYQLVLEVNLSERHSPEEMEPAFVAAFNIGLRKLGLQLEHRTGPLESLIVDRAEKTPTGN